jgi:hypothetical protein
LAELGVVNAVLFEESLALTELYNFVRNNLQAALPFQTAAYCGVSVEQVLKQVLIFVHQQPHRISMSVLLVSFEINQLNAFFRLQNLNDLLIHLQLMIRSSIPSHWVVKKDAVGIRLWS